MDLLVKLFAPILNVLSRIFKSNKDKYDDSVFYGKLKLLNDDFDKCLFKIIAISLRPIVFSLI